MANKTPGRHRIRMITAWNGNIDGDPQGPKTSVAAGEEVDVALSVVQALVLQHQKAELVTIEEIQAKAQEPEEPKKKQAASRTRSRKRPESNKMVTESTDK